MWTAACAYVVEDSIDFGPPVSQRNCSSRTHQYVAALQVEGLEAGKSLRGVDGCQRSAAGSRRCWDCEWRYVQLHILRACSCAWAMDHQQHSHGDEEKDQAAGCSVAACRSSSMQHRQPAAAWRALV